MLCSIASNDVLEELDLSSNHIGANEEAMALKGAAAKRTGGAAPADLLRSPSTNLRVLKVPSPILPCSRGPHIRPSCTSPFLSSSSQPLSNPHTTFTVSPPATLVVPVPGPVGVEQDQAAERGRPVRLPGRELVLDLLGPRLQQPRHAGGRGTSNRHF